MSTAIRSIGVPINADVSGLEWTVTDLDALAALIALITLGQVEHAAEIIATLALSVPVPTEAELFADARSQMRIRGDTIPRRTASRIQRDGYLFECMSWIVARQSGGSRTFLKDPHLDATMHGLDGLILELAPTGASITQATICEDKCTKNPRKKFRDDVMKTFGEHHQNKRARDLIANAAELIRDSGVRGTAAVQAAALVTDKKLRTYRAALTTGPLDQDDRTALFAGYDGLGDIVQSQRIGAVLPLDEPVRDWFDSLAQKVIDALNGFEDSMEKADNV
ncbi:hypothetical protein [Sphingomonas sp. 2SG]|uniref:hypothetical protein n=1 Tax=Sphingomonas sp. 2SG TaxID=2502201 RepID=UPI0010F4C74C|nr:hypothetical protein [Sphingomonas sp. 2SG]